MPGQQSQAKAVPEGLAPRKEYRELHVRGPVRAIEGRDDAVHERPATGLPRPCPAKGRAFLGVLEFGLHRNPVAQRNGQDASDLNPGLVSRAHLPTLEFEGRVEEIAPQGRYDHPVSHSNLYVLCSNGRTDRDASNS
jgi:hypothetical protein